MARQEKATEPTPEVETIVEPDVTDDELNAGRAYDERGNVRPADARMGSVWEIETDRDVIVTRPDGTRVRISTDGERVQHVLDAEGEYSADTGDSVTAG